MSCLSYIVKVSYLLRKPIRFAFFCMLSAFLLQANPPPEEWQIIVPTAAGQATGGNYFPTQFAFDATITWDSVNRQPNGPAGDKGAPAYNDRVGYIDFGPDFDQVHIMETWTRYRTFSGGSHPGYVQMWWDDDTDMVNDSGLSEHRLNFNHGQGVPHIGSEQWFRDMRSNEVGGVRPQARYLMMRSDPDMRDRAQEYAIVGYIYDGLVPPEYAHVPRLSIDQHQLNENAAWRIRVGTLSIEGGESGESYQVNFDSSLPANQGFELLGMELWTTRSFDFEAKSRYPLQLEILDSEDEVTEAELEIEILDREGAFDSNGLATAEVAAAYPEINEGDYVIWNATQSAGPSIRITDPTFSLTPPAKILIKAGVYEEIRLNLEGVNGGSTATRIPITNFLGQVYTRELAVYNGAYWRLTGHYDPAKGLGHADFRGCHSDQDSEDFGFSNGSYGFWVSNGWKNEGESMIYVSGTATGWEMDHIECSDGGFAGMLLKRDNNDAVDMEDVYIHHMYIHDVGSEGIYLGSTQPDPQHQFNRLTIENVLLLRCGTEALQVGQLGPGTIIRNSVFWGAMDWLSPFQRYQDNCVQLGTRNGGVTFEDNILLAGGEKFFNTSVTPKNGISPNGQPLRYENNLMWACRGPHGAYQFKNSDNTTPWIWKENFWGGYVYDYNRVYPGISDSGNCVLMATNGTTVTVTDNVRDSSRQRIIQNWGGNSTIVETGSVEKKVLPPAFLNLLGEGHNMDSLLRWHRWTARVGEDSGFPSNNTSKGTPVTFQPGDVVQVDHQPRTRFYLCLQANSEQRPPLEGDANWELLTWTKDGKTQYCPPDDARLVEGSFYHQRGMGLGGADPLDQDSDMLPDRWERRHGLDAGSALGDDGKDGDPDGDLRSNLEEFMQRSHPAISDRGPELSLTLNGGELELSWPAPEGRAWKFRKCSNLQLGDWQNLTELDSFFTPGSLKMALEAQATFFQATLELEEMLDLVP